MPPKAITARAQAAQDRVTKNTTAKIPAAKKSAGNKKAAAPKRAPKAAGKTTTPRATNSKKRKTVSDDDENEEDEGDSHDEPKAKKTKTSKTAKSNDAKPAPRKAVPKKTGPSNRVVDPASKIKIGVQINFAPTQPLDIFVFGEGSAGELGLGSKNINGRMPIDVMRPRLNPLLSGDVVQFACGGMHGIALTKDNRVLTWGVNDNGALGRDTRWDGGLRDAYAEATTETNTESADTDKDESGLNPFESTPAEIDTRNVAPGTRFVQVAASDSASFALTEDGRVYSWGAFRGSEGILGFNKDVDEQCVPVLLPDSRKIVHIATGSNHAITLDSKGKVQTWGAGQQGQLGRRIVERDARVSSLRPGGLVFKRGVEIAKVAAGSYHSFALTTKGQVYAWGLNNFGELGVEEMMGVDGAAVLQPTLIESLLPYNIVDVAGGEHHSVALTDDGRVLAWGRIDGDQCGFSHDVYNRDNSIYDENDKPRIVRVPTVHETIPVPVSAIAVGTDTSIVVTAAGEAWSWGFNTTYQCGLGETDGEVYPPRAIGNSVVKGRKIVAADCGGQFSMLASPHVAAGEDANSG